MTTYTALKERECAITGQSSTKKEKKERLLALKEECTITKEDMAELDFLNKEEDLETEYRRNIRVVEVRKDNDMTETDAAYETAVDKAKRSYDDAIAQAKAVYDDALVTAKFKQEKKQKASEKSCEKAVDYYTSDKEKRMAKLNRDYTALQRKIEMQKQKIEGEKTLTAKTAAEITLEQDKLKLLKQMQNIIKMIEVFRLTQVEDQYRDQTPLPPVLPEPLVTQYVEPPAPVTPEMKEYYDLEASATAGREMIRQQKLDLARKEREIRIAQSAAEVGEEATQQRYLKTYGRTSRYLPSGRLPTVYGAIHELEKRPHVTDTYVPKPVTDEEEAECNYFTQ